MGDSSRKVFVSYAWGDESERIVNKLEAELGKAGIATVRDKNDLAYKKSIREFMQRIGAGHAVVMVISDKYLRSAACMFELVEVTKHGDVRDRIFPIVLDDARKVYDPKASIEYVEYWVKEIGELNAKVKALPEISNLQHQTEALNDYDEYRGRISNFTKLMDEMNALSVRIHEETGFAALIKELRVRLAADEAATSAPTPIASPPPALAQPKPASSGRTWKIVSAVAVVLVLVMAAMGLMDSEPSQSAEVQVSAPPAGSTPSDQVAAADAAPLVSKPGESAGVKVGSATLAGPGAAVRPAAIVNAALKRPAKQSSIQLGAGAARAVDGVKDGDFDNKSVTATQGDPEDDQPWWQVDLGQMMDVDEVTIWNRTDCCDKRLTNFVVFVSADDMEGRSFDALRRDPNVKGKKQPIKSLGGNSSITIPISAKGRFVRIQLKGRDVLSLAEVEVMASRQP